MKKDCYDTQVEQRIFRECASVGSMKGNGLKYNGSEGQDGSGNICVNGSLRGDVNGLVRGSVIGGMNGYLKRRKSRFLKGRTCRLFKERKYVIETVF